MAQTPSSSTLVIPQLIVGLGNPEPKYEKTRHNIGFDAVDELARRAQIPWSDNRRFQALYGEGRSTNGRKIQLLKPLTYMNRSGQAIRAAIDWYKLPPESVLVIYDDMDLAVGRLRMRLSGSDGGHNGMKSIIAHLNTQTFPRLRIGIGKSGSGSDKNTISHVLGKFLPQETQIISEVLQLAVDAVEVSLTEGVSKAMSLYNSRTVEISD